MKGSCRKMSYCCLGKLGGKLVEIGLNTWVFGFEGFRYN